MIPWKLLLDGKCRPQDTMEKDIELFNAVRSGSLPGALRIYNWVEPALTIGFHQKYFVLSDPSLMIPILRRPTGGGAVLHKDDITFSMSLSHGSLLPTSIPECSERISCIFARAFHQCGLPVNTPGGKHSFAEVCFAMPSPVELMLSGSKLMGLALARKGNFLLVQGVIPLSIDLELTDRVFGTKLPQKPMAILDYMPDFSVDVFVDRLRDSFLSELGVLFPDGDKEYKQRHDADKREVETR
jgi:lipoate-protein ligase A